MQEDDMRRVDEQRQRAAWAEAQSRNQSNVNVASAEEVPIVDGGGTRRLETRVTALEMALRWDRDGNRSPEELLVAAKVFGDFLSGLRSAEDLQAQLDEAMHSQSDWQFLAEAYERRAKAAEDRLAGRAA